MKDLAIGRRKGGGTVLELCGETGESEGGLTGGKDWSSE